MKSNFEEPISFEKMSHDWMRDRMKELLPSNLFTLIDLRHKGWEKKLHAWLKENAVDIQKNKNGGIRILKDGILYAQLKKIEQPEPDVSNN